MIYKPGIERVRKWYEAFWNRELLERPLLVVQSYKDNVEPYERHPADPHTEWTDVDYIIEDREKFFKSRYFAAEAVPYTIVGIQNGALAAFLGCDQIFTHDTNYFKPVIKNWGSYKPNFDPQNSKWWKFTQELTSVMVEAGRDKYFVNLPDFQGTIDSLAHMRGFSQLCLDLYSYPEKIKEALNYMFESVYKPTFTEIRKILTRYTDLTTHWIGIISDKKHDVLQADSLALISPKMAKEFIIPMVRKEAAYLERSIFHFDGPKAVDKLDLLLDIKELDGIQWVPGEGAPTAVHWLPMLKKIQNKGKVLYIYSSPEEVKELVNNLEPKGLIINVSHVFKNEYEADEFINRVEKWCRGNSQS